MNVEYIIEEIRRLESQLVALHEAKYAEYRVTRENPSADKALSSLEVKNIFDEIIDFIENKTMEALDAIDDSIGDLYREWLYETYGVKGYDWDKRDAIEERFLEAGEMVKYEIYSLSAIDSMGNKEWGWEIDNGLEYPRSFMEKVIEIISGLNLNIRIQEL